MLETGTSIIHSRASRETKVGQLWKAILNFFICGSKSLWSAFSKAWMIILNDNL